MHKYEGKSSLRNVSSLNLLLCDGLPLKSERNHIVTVAMQNKFMSTFLLVLAIYDITI